MKYVSNDQISVNEGDYQSEGGGRQYLWRYQENQAYRRGIRYRRGKLIGEMVVVANKS